MILRSDCAELLKGKSFSPARITRTQVHDQAGNVIETHEHKGEFKEP